MIDYLHKFNKIVVTGPQRSGTTIATKMLSYDLGYSELMEESFRIYDKKKFLNILHTRDNFVMQAPSLFVLLMHLRLKDVLVVVMMRNIHDILKSEHRINWDHSYVEKNALNLNLPPSIGKYLYLMNHKPENYILLDYESLKVHPYWVDKEKRAKFAPRQTEI